MFPYLSDLIAYLFGFSFSFPLPMFGFMVAIAFLVANYIWVQEMKRKEAEGLQTFTIIKVIKGEKASISELLGNGLFGFVLGFKVLAIVLDYDNVIADLPGFILSTQGNIIGGLVGASLVAFFKYREAEKLRLPEPIEVEEKLHPYQHVGTMTFVAAIGGILGAKIFDAIENMERLIADPIEVILSGSGLSIYGGLIIGGGAAYMGSSSELFSTQPDIEERITCQDETILVSTTKVPNFPAPGKDLKYYQDRYDNEPSYK